MPETSSCPSLSHLMRLVLGKAAPGDVEYLSRHLLDCQSCREILRGYDAQDTLIQRLEAQESAVEPPVRDLFDRLIRRLQESAAGPVPLAMAPTLAATEAEGSEGPGEACDFLLSAVEPGDLGRLGHYRVLRLLGAGGMGMVFRAVDTHLQRPVALKVLRPKLVSNSTARERFLREARAAAALKHDHVVTIYQVGQENDVPYLAMEFLEGESLEDRIDREGKLPAAEVLRIGREIAEGLAAAHERGLIHRDIKPANIWLETKSEIRSSKSETNPKPENPNPKQAGPRVSAIRDSDLGIVSDFKFRVSDFRVKLLDFGLARPADADSHLTGTGMVVGTPEFMAPEQARGEALDGRCDLFSLGSVLYRMATGRPAFSGSTTMAVLTALAVDQPPSLTEIDPGLPKGLADLVEALLAKKPADRPASARAVVEALQALEQGESPKVTSSIRKAPTRLLPAATAPRITRRGWLTAGVVLALVAGLACAWWHWGNAKPAIATGVPPVGPPLKVGVLHSLSGPLADDGNAVADATLLAIEEINEKGGLLGRPVEPIVCNGQAEWDLFAREAERLITEERVCTIFGCWTSASRKTVKPVVEKHDHLLVYPLQYEGLEQSPNIVYNGATPNQQILPAVSYCYGELKKRRFFLVGSDYVFPRAANAIIRDKLKELGAQVAGERYLLLDGNGVSDLVKEIAASGADVILNTINGDTNRAFFRALRAAGIKPDKVPTVSFSLGEHDLIHLNLKDMVGDYAAWNYFQSIERPENAAFVRRFRDKYGSQKVVSDPMEAAYFGVHLWAQAVTAAASDDVRAIRRALKGQRFDAPEGPVHIDPDTQHTWKIFRMGRIVAGGQFEVIASSEKPLKPEPYPASRTPAEWDRFLNELHQKWGGRWANPGTR